MLGKAALDEGQHLAGDRVGWKADGLWQRARAALGKGTAVGGVEVPGSAGRLAPLHQHVELLAERPVEVFQPQLLAARGMLGKRFGRGEKMAVGADLKRQAQPLGCVAEALPNTPLARLDHDQPLGLLPGLPEGLDAGGECLGEACRLAGGLARLELPVVDADPPLAEPLAEMPHRGEKDRDPGLVGPDMLRLLGHLRHPHRIDRGIKAIKGSGCLIELITEHEEKVAGHGAAWAGGAL